MRVGVVKEIRNNEHRVGLVPAGVHALTEGGHDVYVEKGSGLGSGIPDEDYVTAGGRIIDSPETVYGECDIVVKVKAPTESEYSLLRHGQALFAFLHLAVDRPLTDVLLEKKITGIAYETVTDRFSRLPLLTPMSEVAGRLSVQIGAQCLLKYNGGSGVLLGGVPGVSPGRVVIIGGGTVGANAAKIAVGMGAAVTIMDTNLSRLRELDDIFGSSVHTMAYSQYAAAELLKTCDLLISGVLLVGRKAPRVVTADMVRSMKKGSVIVDLAIDHGGSIETVDRITSHDNPTYEVFGVVHYSVPNIAGSVPYTATRALTNATLPFILEMAGKGVLSSIRSNLHLKDGVNTYGGHVTYKAVADTLDLPYENLDTLLW